MAIFVYRRANSVSARALADMLQGGRRWRVGNPLIQANDAVVCWGEGAPGNLPTGVRVLNPIPLQSKYTDAVQLRNSGVPTIEVSRTRPPQAPPIPVAPQADPAQPLWGWAQEVCGDFAELPFARGAVSLQTTLELRNLFDRLRTALATPVPVAPPAAPVQPWIPRLNNHTGGRDLLHPPVTPDFWVKKENIASEIRIHCFLGRSIRAGRKVVREGFFAPGQANPLNLNQPANPWIRSYDGGWKIDYDGFQSTPAQRDLAQNACNTLGLQFGAVDIGIRGDGSMLVLEVNRAPGLEGGTVTSYATAIQGWLNGTEARGAEPRRARGARRA
jgi:hypothetical protein